MTSICRSPTCRFWEIAIPQRAFKWLFNGTAKCFPVPIHLEESFVTAKPKKITLEREQKIPL
jgi:hypothetical protein